MSIVGTRPPLISETNLYELHHRARLAIKPGITGMWQVSGRSDITDFEEVVRLDKEYIIYGKLLSNEWYLHRKMGYINENCSSRNRLCGIINSDVTIAASRGNGS